MFPFDALTENKDIQATADYTQKLKAARETGKFKLNGRDIVLAWLGVPPQVTQAIDTAEGLSKGGGKGFAKSALLGMIPGIGSTIQTAVNLKSSIRDLIASGAQAFVTDDPTQNFLGKLNALSQTNAYGDLMTPETEGGTMIPRSETPKARSETANDFFSMLSNLFRQQ